MSWRYEPKDNRTPVNHPLIGHLEWGQVYDNPLCAENPDFVEVKPKRKAKPVTPPSAARPAGDSPADIKSASESPANQVSAGKTGRS